MKYLFFDLDGTLTESTEGICNAAQYALEKFGITGTSRAQLESYIGPPLNESFSSCGLNEEQVKEAIRQFRIYYERQGKFENRVYPGIPELLQLLKNEGYTLVVATSKPEHFTNQILEHFDLEKYFNFVAGATVDEQRTQKDEVIAWALSGLGITDRGSVIMIGDRKHDVLGARKEGIRCIGVLYGYGSREELEAAGAAAIAETVENLPEVLKALEADSRR